MIGQIRYTAKWVRYRLQDRLGQRGAEMIEYALLLACIAILGYWFYGTKKGNPNDKYDAMRLNTLPYRIWNKIAQFITTAQKK